MKKHLSIIIALSVFAALLTPHLSLANGFPLNLTYPHLPGAPDLNTAQGQTLSGIVRWVYSFVVGISGLAAFLMILWGGVQWLSSSGNASQMADARSRIQQALLWLVLVLSSYLILQLINPDLTQIVIPGA